MQRATKKNPYDVITNAIIAQLEAGTVPWRKPWHAEHQAPRNLAGGNRYRGINIFLLLFSGYSDPNWLTFRQAKKLGGSVRRGEKGTPVVFWKWYEKTNAETGEVQRLPVLRTYTVFNVTQCEDIETPAAQAMPAETWDSIAEAEAIVAGWDNAPAIEDGFGGAYYRPATDTVRMPARSAFAEPGEYFSTLFHELAHATGHAERLGRPGVTDGARYASHAYSKEELVAEMTSAFLCGEAVIGQAVLENSAAYIAHWLERLKGDSKLVVQAAAQAQKAADHILGREFAPRAI